MKNILFVFAHFDDESFSAGTIKKLVTEGNNVSILIICGNGKDLEDDRKDIFQKNISLLGCDGSFLNYFDLTLDDLKEDVKREIKDSLTNLILSEKIDIVYTNNADDMHSDHKAVSALVRTVCRPSITNIKSLYECYISGATEFGSYLWNYNTIIDITYYANPKGQCLKNYDKYLKGASSHEASMNHSRYIGSLYNMNYAETFKLIWHKE